MKRVIVLAAILGAASNFVWSGAAVAASSNPTVQLSTGVLRPPHSLVISGSGWPDGTYVDATICGDDAVSGTEDCAVTSTATMIATTRGLIWSRVVEVIPPAPCPCVVLVTGATTGFSKKIPVQIVGATTAPITLPHIVGPAIPTISEMRVVGGSNLGSLLGGGAPRTIEFRLTNAGSVTVVPVLIGRWGGGHDPANVIKMPSQAALRQGKSREVRVPFQLGALAMGDNTVHVEVQVVGDPGEMTARAPTSQWPLFLLALFVLSVLAVVSAVSSVIRRRFGRPHGQEPAVEDSPDQQNSEDGHGLKNPSVEVAEAPKDPAPVSTGTTRDSSD